ncbi:hypothetical protein N0V93_003390 [Gnomoniopsis smithogilvyi]|uniref:Protein kinase domain-containing protein n=1 Tax=Gnomoniopsis smithogilvyi TaxID=1191159 RepID=A0A9W8YZ62_9PEZI|nr:hypothetical protein N0V93_003390 [Gnomoniopsis smithogilvyi]
MPSNTVYWSHTKRDEEMVAWWSSPKRQECFLTPSPSNSPPPEEVSERNTFAQSGSSFLCFNKDSELAQQLLAEMRQSKLTNVGNIPRDNLAKLLTVEMVQHELKDFAGNRTVREIAEKIAMPGLTFSGIFAILVLMKKTFQISGFLSQTFPTVPIHQDCGISDYDLPLVMMYDESKRQIVLRRGDYPEAHLDCFDGFTAEEIMAFEKWQWSVLDEDHFRHLKSAGSHNRCERWHYNFSPNEQIPLVRPNGLSDSVLMRAMVGKDTDKAGSNGEVSLWALKDLTRSRPMPDGTGNINLNCQLVAVKKSRESQSFLSERRAAALISADSHPHIVPLLFSFSHMQQSYLVLPWASLNLADYWKENEIYLQNEPHMEYSRVLWVAEQCEGLADALRYIHRFVSASPDGSTRVISYHHGNIKPENILVYYSSHQRPVLQLADFGNSTCTAEVDLNGRPHNTHHIAGDYTAPEVYFGEPVSSKSDVWSLCCVFLDFIEWLMPSQSAPGQPKRVLTDFEENWGYVQGREAFVDWRRSRVESGPEDVATYFFDTSTGELSLWIDTVSEPLNKHWFLRL